MKSDYRQIVPFFLSVLVQGLRTMGFSKAEIDWILGQNNEMTVGRATDRSTLGSLNNRIADTKAILSCDSGLSISDIGRLTKMLNETPMKPIGYSNGLEQMRGLVDRLRLGTATADSDQNEGISSANAHGWDRARAWRIGSSASLARSQRRK